jgi:hypothetical protein
MARANSRRATAAATQLSSPPLARTTALGRVLGFGFWVWGENGTGILPSYVFKSFSLMVRKTHEKPQIYQQRPVWFLQKKDACYTQSKK